MRKRDPHSQAGLRALKSHLGLSARAINCLIAFISYDEQGNRTQSCSYELSDWDEQAIRHRKALVRNENTKRGYLLVPNAGADTQKELRLWAGEQAERHIQGYVGRGIGREPNGA